MGIGLVIFFCNLSQNTCFVYIFWIGLSLERGVYVMARRRKCTNKNMEKKNHLERVNKWQYTPSVFKGQIGHF